MKNTNNNLFKENRLVMRGKPSSSAERNRQEIDDLFAPMKKADPVKAAKEKAKRLMDKKQRETFELARKSSVIDATKKIFKLVKGLEKDKRTLTQRARKNADPVSRRVAMGYILDAADSIGARGKGRSKIRMSKIQQASDFSATLSAVVENLLYKEFYINDVTDSKQFDNIQTVLERVSKKGKGAIGRQKVWDKYNKFAILANKVSLAKDELK